jgi:AcrR family transcriptional regulator
MVTERRMGPPDAKNRAILLDAAQQLMLDEGYAAVTSRRVAQEAGLKSQLVHYYFRTMDELFLALVRRGAEQNLERQARALASSQPLRAFWRYSTDPVGTTLTMELSALSNHRKAIRAELAAYAEDFRQLQSETLGAILARYGVSPDRYPTEAMLVLITAVSQVLGMEEALGFTRGHAEMQALVERFITEHEGPPDSAHEPSTNG